MASMMLMGVALNVNAQDEVDYSLEGIGKTLSKLNLFSPGLCLGDFHEGIAWVRVKKGVKPNLAYGSDDWYGYIDTKGNVVTPCIYLTARNFSEGYACVENEDGNFGFIDKQGNTVIPFKYKQIGSFSEGLASFRTKDNDKGYLNKKGEIAIPNISGEIFHGGIAPVRLEKYLYYFIDKSGEKVIPEKPFRCIGYKDSLFVMETDKGRFGLMDTKGNIVVPTKYDGIGGLSEGLCITFIRKEERSASGYSVKRQYCILDVKKGTETRLPQYEEVRSFSEGLAAVKLNEKWGYINIKGELVIPYKFKKAYCFHKGTAFVKAEEGYQIIDKQGNTVLRLPNYDYFGETSSEGLAVIYIDGRWGYVDIYGNSTLNPDFTSGNENPSSLNN
jgi:hypothetical protein